MSKTIKDVCHDFFYDGDGSSYRRHYCTVSYDNDTFYSYNTAIARIVAAHNGETVCLISYDSFSRTTAKHLCYLKQACPLTRLFVPAQYECNTLDEEDVLQWFFADLNRAAAQKLTQAANRNGFINTFEYFQRFLNYFHDLLLTKEQEEQLEKHKELYDTLNSSDGVKKLKEKQRQEALQRAKAFKELCANNNITELAQKAYGACFPVLTNDEKAKLRKTINPSNAYSFVWYSTNGYYYTSQHITMSEREGNIFLKRLYAGKVKHGDMVDRYTVMAVTKDAVKIGCHLIPMQNLKELYEQMIAREKAQEVA